MTKKIAFVDWWDPRTNGDIVEETFRSYFLDTYEFKEVALNEDPDFIICSYFGMQRVWNPHNAVSLLYSPENVTAMAPIHSQIAYNHMKDVQYLLGSEFERPLFIGDDVPYHYVPYSALHYDVPLMWKKWKAHREKMRDVARDRPFCSFVVSNTTWGAGTYYRRYMHNWLDTYKTVTCGGGYANNIGGRAPRDRFIEWLSFYKFNICFENSTAPGYNSEKIMQAYFAGSIPIYWGDRTTVEYLYNPKSFIYADSYEEVLKKVKHLDNDPAAYYEMYDQNPFNVDPTSVSSPFNLAHVYHFFDEVVETEFPSLEKRINDQDPVESSA